MFKQQWKKYFKLLTLKTNMASISVNILITINRNDFQGGRLPVTEQTKKILVALSELPFFSA